MNKDDLEKKIDSEKEFPENSIFYNRSEVILEIIDKKPDFWEKWAILTFSSILILLLLSTWFIKYPEIIEGTAILKGENAPKEIISNQSGKLITIFAKNNQYVSEGEVIGWLESNASTEDIIRVSKLLNESIKLLDQKKYEDLSKLFKRRFSNLGELQMQYQGFVNNWLQFNDYLVNGFYYKQKKMLMADILSLKLIDKKNQLQKDLAILENQVANETFEMNGVLYSQKALSIEEYRQAKNVLLSKQKLIPQIDIGRLNGQNQIRQKQKEIDQLNHDIIQQKQIFEQALFSLKSTVDDWLRKFTIKAPIDGQIVFILPLQKNQTITQGKLLGYVNPNNSKYYAEVRLSQKNFGKLDTGMKVQLRFEAYPYQEIGFIKGRLNYISKVAIDSGFVGTIELEQSLSTNQGKKIQYKSGLKAQALIITKDMRLLERLCYNIIRFSSINK